MDGRSDTEDALAAFAEFRRLNSERFEAFQQHDPGYLRSRWYYAPYLSFERFVADYPTAGDRRRVLETLKREVALTAATKERLELMLYQMFGEEPA